MRNLVLLDRKCTNMNARECVTITFDNLNETFFAATNTKVFVHSLLNHQMSNHTISLSEGGFLNERNKERILDVYFLPDQEELSIITSKGDLIIWKNADTPLELIGCIESGITCSQWSSDGELIALTTGDLKLLLMTCEFDPVFEQHLHSEEFGEALQVSVGWGRKETQFHGSEGKNAALKGGTKATLNSWDDGHLEISWRGDGQYFCISLVNSAKGHRTLKIYNRDAVLQATSEAIEGLESCIAWRPSGSLIACTQRTPNKHNVVFIEKNGLQHGGFTLPFTMKENIVLKISWSSNSDLLMILVTDFEQTSNKYTAQIWNSNNYHWYLKQELCYDDHISRPCLMWDQEIAYKLHILLSDGCYAQNTYINRVTQSSGPGNVSMVGVIDGAKLLLTPLKRMVIPPPMSFHSVVIAQPVLLLAFSYASQHDIILQMSNHKFQCLIYAQGDYTSENITTMELLSNTFRHMVWYEQDRIAMLADGGNTIMIFELVKQTTGFEMVLLARVNFQASLHVLFQSADGKLLVEDRDGCIHILKTEDSVEFGESICTLPLVCSNVACTLIGNERFVFGLTEQYRLFVNSREIASNCTSFLLHDEFLLLSTHSHTLRCIYLQSLKRVTSFEDLNAQAVDEATRRVERGSRLVSVVSRGTSVIMQMPRGNLECIHPRSLVITHLKTLLNNLEYREAMSIMRKNRVNLNLLYDHDPKLFMDNVDRYLDEMTSVNDINLFLADLQPEDVCTTLYYPFYYHGNEKTIQSKNRSSDEKVDFVCGKVKEALLRKDDDRLLLALLTTYARQTKPDLESVLLKIKELRDSPLESSISYGQALSYILYLVDVNTLYDIALGLYDFDLVVMVAEKSQKDPKEYLPFLKSFQEMSDCYRRFSIDKHLKRYSKALLSIATCEDRFTECIYFIKEHRLYKEALLIFPQDSEQYKSISHEYGFYLTGKKLYEDAGIVWSHSGLHEKALDAFMKTTNWSMALTQAHCLKYEPVQMMQVSRTLAAHLKSECLYKDAAYLLEHYAKDLEECVVCYLDGGCWFNALHTIHVYERQDLIETHLKPTMLECYESIVVKINDLQKNFDRHTTRLSVVVAEKDREQLEIQAGFRDDDDDDLYSDTTSITGKSALSTSSKGSRSSGNSSKSRKKVARKKFSLKEGSKHEGFALREALAEIINRTDVMIEDIGGLLKILVFYFYENKAGILQAAFDDLLKTFDRHMNDIWNDNKSDKPNVSVNSILSHRSAEQLCKDDLPRSTVPNIRTNVLWKMDLLSK